MDSAKSALKYDDEPVASFYTASLDEVIEALYITPLQI
jgi:hypothetical protein